jgi:fucose permease
MTTLLIVIIYLAFISLGLPDSLLGSAWPSMYQGLGSTISGAGNIFMIISAGTIFSSLMSDRVIHKFGTGKVTAASVAMTASSLFGFASCTAYWQLCLLAIPYGLGAGAIDSALNNYVALHLKARHMSWLHCMWGIGASVGPYIMGMCLTAGHGWQSGYRTIGFIQVVITALIFCSLPLWKGESSSASDEENSNVLTIPQALRLTGAPQVLLCFFGYCALEQSVGLWAGSWLNVVKNIPAETAASYASMFYIGITIGRALSGFITEKMGDKRMIRIGLVIIGLGCLILIFSGNNTPSLIGLVVVGLGCAPIYPSVIHSTPFRFGKENSQSLVGLQMASAYVGTTFMPKLFGVLSDIVGITLFPIWILLLLILIIVMSEWANRRCL